MMTGISRTQILSSLLFVLGLVLSLLMVRTLMIHTDNLQIMDKAVHYVETNELIHYGNRATKVGSIPGSFLTAVTAIPMKIYFHPYSAAAVILLFHILSFLFLYITFKNEKWFSVLGLVVLYWLNPWRLEQVELYNPGYLFLFSALHLWTALKMDKKNFYLTLIHCLLIGFCAQVHFSALILAILTFLLFITKKIKVNWWGFFSAVFLVGLSLVPYYLQKSEMAIAAVDLTHSDAFLGRNLILVYPVLKGILYFFRMGSFYFGRHIFSEINFLWIENTFLRNVISYLFHALKWVLAAGSLFFSFKIIGGFLYNTSRNIKSSLVNLDLFDSYFYGLFISAVIATALSPVEFNHWHLIICFPAVSIFILKNITQFFTFKRWILLGSIFLVWGLFLNLGSRSHSYTNDYARDFFIHYRKVNK